MLTIKDIYQLIHDECGIKPEKLFPDSDLNSDFGVEGDDFNELMLAYSVNFKSISIHTFGLFIPVKKG